jgi:hypothetical protein
MGAGRGEELRQTAGSSSHFNKIDAGQRQYHAVARWRIYDLCLGFCDNDIGNLQTYRSPHPFPPLGPLRTRTTPGGRFDPTFSLVPSGFRLN